MIETERERKKFRPRRQIIVFDVSSKNEFIINARATLTWATSKTLYRDIEKERARAYKARFIMYMIEPPFSLPNNITEFKCQTIVESLN